VDNNSVKALARYTNTIDEGYLVVGGNFTSIDVGTSCTAIFQYNLTTPAGPSAVGPSFTFLSAGADVKTLADAPDPTIVYVGGSFTDGSLITNAFYFSYDDPTAATEYTVADVVQAILMFGSSPYFGLASGLQVDTTVVSGFTDPVTSFTYKFGAGARIMIGTSVSPYLYNMLPFELITVDGVVGPGGTSPATIILSGKGSSVSVIRSAAFNVWWIQSTWESVF
jgi:hypothetical protein